MGTIKFKESEQADKVKYPITFTGDVEGQYDGSAPLIIHLTGSAVEPSPPSPETPVISDMNIVTPEQFGAKGDGVTDDSDAFRKAILTKKRVVCDPSKRYMFKKPVDVKETYTGHLDINNSILLNFHIIINLNDSKNDWRQSYPTTKFTIENGKIGSDNWNQAPTDWTTPCILTGSQIILRNLEFCNSPYIMAIANEYLDFMLLDSILCVMNHDLFTTGTLTLDAVSGIDSSGQFKRIDRTLTKLAGDSWVFKQCSEFYNKYNKDYRLVSTHLNQPVLFEECIQSAITTDYGTCSIFLGCHWEEPATMPIIKETYLSSAVFINCFFWGNYILKDDPRVKYTNCKFTQTENNDIGPKQPLSAFTANKSFYELQCRLENCCVGGWYIVDTDKLKYNKTGLKYTLNRKGRYVTALSSVNLTQQTSNRNYANFTVGQYTYDIYLLQTDRLNIAYDYAQKQISVLNKGNMVWFQIANAVGGFGIRIVRKSPNGDLYETYNFTDPLYPDDLNTNKNLVFYDYGDWAHLGFNGNSQQDLLSQIPSPWIKITQKPQIQVKKYLQNGGILSANNIQDQDGLVDLSKNPHFIII